MKKRICGIILTAAFFCSPAFALPSNPNTDMSYHYNATGQPVDSPPAYVPALSLRLSGDHTAKPMDFAINSDTIFVLDSAGGQIFRFGLDYTSKGVLNLSPYQGEKVQLNEPKGLFLTENGRLYIADTENKRIVVCDLSGTVERILTIPFIKVMNKQVDFHPSKLAVDRTGRMFVVANNINRGLVVLEPDGGFSGFIGAPDVKIDFSLLFWRAIANKEQRKSLSSFVPTEYNNVAIDADGFLYATIGTLDADAVRTAITTRDKSGTVTPVRKLNTAGDDILVRNGFFAPLGDLKFDVGAPSVIVDAAVHPHGMYTLADSRRGRLFTYDQEGNLLYICGGKGDGQGAFDTISAIAARGDDLLVADEQTGIITVLRATEYGSRVNSAVAMADAGKYAEADTQWNLVLTENSNLYAAYVGKGKAEYRQGNYAAAMRYFKISRETEHYSKAKRMLRTELLSEYSALLWVVIVVLCGGMVYLLFRGRRRVR